MPTEKPYIGRAFEIKKLKESISGKEPVLTIVYGRRRIGESFLIETVLKNEKYIKFEGTEKKDFAYQIQTCMDMLAKKLHEPEIARKTFVNWRNFFEYLAEKFKKKQIVLYFEEVQWLAEYKTDFASELKHVWDNYFSKLPNIKIILCGSATSFIVKHIINSIALYGRSQREIFLKGFAIQECREFLGDRRKKFEVLDAILTTGSVPAYLKYLKKSSSIMTSLAENSFLPQSYFLGEFNKIFISSLSEYRYYKQIINLLSQKKYLSREQLSNSLKINSGGTFSEVLDDLDMLEFIDCYSTFEGGDRNSKLIRYCIQDNYLHFYYKFIAPKIKKISNSEFVDDPISAINRQAYAQFLGYSLERFCLKNTKLIANILNFSGIEYDVGSWFKRGKENLDFQIDLVFDRKDKVQTLCELKYQSQPVRSSVIKEFEQKIAALGKYKKGLQRVLIAPNGAEKSLYEYFDRVITIEDLI